MRRPKGEKRFSFTKTQTCLFFFSVFSGPAESGRVFPVIVPERSPKISQGTTAGNTRSGKD